MIVGRAIGMAPEMGLASDDRGLEGVPEGLGRLSDSLSHEGDASWLQACGDTLTRRVSRLLLLRLS